MVTETGRYPVVIVSDGTQDFLRTGALVLDLSAATVKNEWAFARAWLYRALGPIGPPAPDGLR